MGAPLGRWPGRIAMMLWRLERFSWRANIRLDGDAMAFNIEQKTNQD